MAAVTATSARGSWPAAQASRRAGAFTLVELMLVLLLIGILGSVGVSGFRHYAKKADRTEAFVALKTIADLQVSYHTSNFEYADSFEKLAFDVSSGPGLQPDGSVIGDRYTYTLQTWPLDGKPNANYRATATADLDPGDAVLDIIIIENQLTVKE